MTAEPQSFGKYPVVRSLGRGGMAAVYEGRDPLLERRVAIKVILPHLAEDATFADRFRLEARLVASLRHPHIVRLYDFDIVDGRPYMVMEFLEGGSLKERLAEYSARIQNFPLEDALIIIHNLADALQYAHSRSAVHRDIKPANILFTAQNEAVITDFGIAKLLHESQQISNTGGIIGTPQYMSPEQASGRPVDGRSDQYSLAITAYEMLSGRVPFTGETATAILLAHLTETPPSPRRFNPKLSPAIEAVLLQGLAKDPAERFESTVAFAEALLEAAHSRAAPSQPEAITADVPTQIDTGAGISAEPASDAPATEAESSRRLEIASPPEEALQRSAASIPATIPPQPGRTATAPPKKSWRRWAILGSCLALAAAVFILLAPRMSSLISSPTTIPVADEFVIAVADFDGAQATQKIDIARRIYEELESQLSDLDSKVRLVRTNKTYPDKQTAITAGQETGADLMVWGWYDDAGVSPSIQGINREPPPAEMRGSIFYSSALAAGLDTQPGMPEIGLEDFTSYLRKTRQVSDMGFFFSSGPEQIAAIAEAVLGMAFLTEGELDTALSMFDKALANPNLAPGNAPAEGLEDVYFSRGIARAKLNRLPEAIADLEQAALLNAQIPEIFYNLAMLYPEMCSPQRNLGKALEAATKAADLAPQDGETRNLLASILNQMGRYSEAQLAAQAAVDLDPQNAENYLLQGDILKAQGNLTPAQAAWERGVALLEAQLPEPGQVRVEDLIRLGDAYLQAGRADQARQTYLQAQAMDSGNPDVQRGLGNAAINLGDLAGAEQAYSAWVAAAPDDPTALNALGVVQVKQNRAVEGRETLRKAMDASPCSSATSLLDGGQYILEGKYPEAEAAFTRAAEIEPDNPSTLYLLGVSQYLQEKLEPAAATLERALQIDPELVQVKRALATALGELNRYEEALPLWLEVVQKLPDDPSGWMSLGTAHEKLGSYDQAIDAYTQALKLGDDANIHSYIGLVFLEKGQPDKAAQEFDLALKLNPQSSLAYGGKGDAYLQMGEVASAIAAYRKSLTLQENVPLRAQLGALLLQTGDLEGAARELGAAVQADPVNAPYREQLGKVLYRLGHLDESMQQYQSILDVDANNSSAWLGLGQIAYKRCDLEGMAQAFEHAAGLQRGNAYYQALPGAAYAAKGAVEQQAQVYFNLGQDFPDDPVALLIGGEYAWQQGDLPAAVEKLEQAAQTGEAMPEIKSLIYYHLGAMSLIQNELVDAEEQFRSSLEASPANAASQTALGDIFLLRGDAVQALEAYTLALELLPGYAAQFSGDAADLLGPELHARRALALERLGEDTEAEQAWEQAVTLARRLIDQTPDWPQAHHSLGSILYMSGDDAQAEDEFTQMAECDAWLGKVNPQALTYLDRLR